MRASSSLDFLFDLLFFESIILDMGKTLIALAKISGIALLILLMGVIVFVFFTGPRLPANTDRIIDDVMRSELPELVKGRSGYVVSDGHRIWYELIAPKSRSKGTILLFSGMATDALMWPQAFIDKLTGSGYQVIRFDYRGTGASDWVRDWKEKPYSVVDLAKDAKAVLDALKVRKAHLVGMSLGGMVAQEFALEYPARARSLTSLMSSGDIYDKELPKASNCVVRDFTKIGVKYGLVKSERNTIKMMLAAQIILRGYSRYDLDVKGTAERVLYNLRRRKGYNPDVSGQHDQAARLWVPRLGELKNLRIPVLVIHGKNDPFVPIEHSQKLAAAVPHSEAKWFDNMGHDLPPNLVDAIGQEIIDHIKNAR